MAARYWVGGAGNWSSTTKWSTTSGGASGASVPTSVDDAIFDTNSGGKFVATVDTAQTVNSLTITQSAGAGLLQIAITASLTTGNLTTAGTAGNNRIWFRSTTYGISTSLVVNGTVSVSDCDFRGVYVTGTAAPISGTRLGDRGESRGVSFSAPKTVYWNLAAGGNWSATAWASASGGAVSTDNQPLPQDTAIIENTGLNTSATITLDAALLFAGSVDFSGRTNAMTLALTGGSYSIYGSWTNGSGVAFSGINGPTFTGGGLQTITSAGKAFPGTVTIDTYGGTVQLADALNVSAVTLTVTNGTFTTNGYAVTVGTLSSSNSNVRTINLGGSTVTITASIVFTVSTNLTFNAGTSSVVLSGSFSGVDTLSLGGLTYYNFTVVNTSTSTHSPSVTGANTFNNFTYSNTAAPLHAITFTATQTFNGTLTCSGGSVTKRMFLASSTLGTQRTITAAAISATDCDFRDIVLAGAAAGAAPTRAGDCGNNSGITFPAAKTVYWNLAGTQNWSATGWATSSGGTPAATNFPLAQDTAVFDDTGSAGTVTLDAAWNIGTFNASARTTAMTFSTSTVAPNVYGNWLWGTGVTSSSTTGTVTFSKPGTQIITSNGVQFGCPVTTNNPAGTVQLADALSLGSTRTLTVANGTFDAVTYNVTTGVFVFSANTTVKMGAGTWTLSGAGTVWNAGIATLIAGTSTIVLSNTGTGSRTFAGGAFYYNKLTIGGATGTSTTTINNANTFGELASAKTVAHTITFQSGTMHTIGKWSVTGTAGNVVTLAPGTAATTYTLFIAGPAVTGIDYLSVSYCAVLASSPGEFYVGANSTNTVGNTGSIIFTATPTPRDLYWVGGTGNWSATTSWSTSSGGTSGAAVPTSLDSVTFDSASNATAYTATIDAGVTIARCAALTVAGPASGNVTLAGTVPIAIHGNTSFAATGVTRSYTGAISLAGNASYTFTTNGVSFVNATTVTGIGATWTLGSAYTAGSTFTVTYGTFSTSASNYALSVTTFTSNSATVRSVSFNGSTITCSGSGPAMNLAGPTNFTFAAGTSQINISSTAASVTAPTPNTFYNVAFTNTAATSCGISGANTFNNLSFAGRTSAGINAVTFSADQIINGTLTLAAGTDATMRTFLASNTIGTQRTLSVAALAAGSADYDFRDIAITGAAAPIAPTRAGDCKGNAGITFPAAKTVYWNFVTGGNWGTTVGWAASSGGTPAVNNFPLAQDTAVFEATGLNTGSTVTVSSSYNIGTIDMSARTSNLMSLSTGTTAAVYGNWINGTGTTLIGTSTLTFAGRGSQTLTSAGKTFTQAITVNSAGGSLTLQDAFVNSNSQLILTAGTFDAATYNVTFSSISAGTALSTSGTLAKTIAFGSGTWTFAGSGSQASVASPTTVTGTGTLRFTNVSAKTFAGNGLSYSDITLDNGGAGTLVISGNNTFKSITNSYSATGAATISLAATTQTITGSWGATGASGNVLTVSGTSAASPATLVFTGSGLAADVDYLAVQNVRAYPVTTSWYAGANSTNNGSLGWYFAVGPTVYTVAVNESATSAEIVAAQTLHFAVLSEATTALVQNAAQLLTATTVAEGVRASATTQTLVRFLTAVSEAATVADIEAAALRVYAAVIEQAAGAAVASAVMRFATTVSETATASERAVAATVLQSAVRESTAAQAVFTAFKRYTAAVQEAGTASSTLFSGSTYVATVAEQLAGTAVGSALAQLRSTLAETARVSTAQAAALTAISQILEATTASASLTPRAVCNTSVLDTAQAADQDRASFTFNIVLPTEGARAADSLIGKPLWDVIDDMEIANWQPISNPQSPSWSDVDDNTDPDWQNVQN